MIGRALAMLAGPMTRSKVKPMTCHLILWELTNLVTERKSSHQQLTVELLLVCHLQYCLRQRKVEVSPNTSLICPTVAIGYWFYPRCKYVMSFKDTIQRD